LAKVFETGLVENGDLENKLSRIILGIRSRENVRIVKKDNSDSSLLPFMNSQSSTLMSNLNGNVA